MVKKSHNRKKTKVRERFGAKLKKLRLKQGMTQEELSEKSGLHQIYVGSVERGERNISLENIVALARGLKCSPNDLLSE